MADEAAMTGESDHFPKESIEKCLQRQAEHEDQQDATRDHHDVPSPIVLSGTQIQTGSGWFVCIVVGDMTCEGQILASVEEKPNEDTPLQEKLDVIAIDIGKLGMYAAILIIHCLLLRNFIEGMVRKDFDLFGGEKGPDTNVKCDLQFNYCLDPAQRTAKEAECAAAEVAMTMCSGEFNNKIKGWLRYLIVGVAIVVVAVPEGLPLAVMISLAYSVSKMLKDQNFVKRLASCEIMGGANNICSDKTGTLTKNQMTWTQIWCGGDHKIDDPDGSAPFRTESFCNSKTVLEQIRQAVSCNTEGTIKDGGATEVAMLKFIDRCETDVDYYRQKYLPTDLLRFQFDSARKRMSTLLELEEDDETEHGYPKRLHTKGASEIILKTCTHFLDSNGEKQIIDDQVSQELLNIIQ